MNSGKISLTDSEKEKFWIMTNGQSNGSFTYILVTF